MAPRAALPLEPLYSIVTSTTGHTEMTNTEFARRVNTTVVAVNRWKKQGGIPWVSADEAAVAIGLHPLLVWGDAWLNVKGDFDRLAAQATAELEAQLTARLEAEGMEGNND